MNKKFEKVQSLLQEKADYLSRKKFLEYEVALKLKQLIMKSIYILEKEKREEIPLNM